MEKLNKYSKGKILTDTLLYTVREFCKDLYTRNSETNVKYTDTYEKTGVK